MKVHTGKMSSKVPYTAIGIVEGVAFWKFHADKNFTLE